MLIFIGYVHMVNNKVFVMQSQQNLPFHVDMITNFQYGTAEDGTQLLMDFAYPRATPGMPKPEKMPVIINIHGGGWYTGQRGIERGLLMPLQGFFYASIEYRLSGQAIFPAQIHDVKAAIRWVRAHAEEYNLDPDRIGLYGGSAGGHLSALAACTADLAEFEGECGWAGFSTRVHAVVAANPPTDLTVSESDWEWLYSEEGTADQFLGGAIKDNIAVAKLASPITHVTSDAPPHLLIHGTDDDIVPFSQSQLYHNALIELGVESKLIIIDDADHGLYGYSAHVWEPITKFFKQHLGQPINYGDRSKIREVSEKLYG